MSLWNFQGSNLLELDFPSSTFLPSGCFFPGKKKTPVPCSFSWIFTPSWWQGPTVKIGYTLVKELKVKHLISSNLKTLDRYLVLSNQHQTLMSKSCDTLRRFDSYLMCLALVVSFLWNFEDLKHYIKNMCKTMLEKNSNSHFEHPYDNPKLTWLNKRQWTRTRIRLISTPIKTNETKLSKLSNLMSLPLPFLSFPQSFCWSPLHPWKVFPEPFSPFFRHLKIPNVR